jgi:hypothetical protein
MSVITEAVSETAVEVPAVAQEPATFTLSDLIRLGSAQTEQAVGSWGDGEHTACALTAAYVGAKIAGLIQD